MDTSQPGDDLQMRFKLSYKLFGAFLLILVIVSGAMLLSRYIFARTFRNYIHQMELEKLKRLVPLLQEEYGAQGNWGRLKSNPRQWRYLISALEEGESAPPPSLFEGGVPKGSKPPPGHGAPPPDRGPPPGVPPGIVLMDARHQSVVGIPIPDDLRDTIAIEVDGEIVGWLGIHNREPFKSGRPAVLFERQTRQLSILGVVVIALTAIIAMLFSRSLLRPIRQLIRGTRELSRRNFTIRIASATGDELGQLAENFNTMAHTLENYEKMRLQWLSDISHELRTPLAVLRGEVEALQDGVREPSPANLSSLHTEILRISRLVEDLHLLSMADSDQLLINKQQISPCRVLSAVIESYQTRLDQCRIKIDARYEAVGKENIEGDADRLGQVFGNILENACKYVNPPGTLVVSGQTEDRALTFRFEDSGPGVPEESLSRLFDRLFRVETSRNRDSGGSGLGLSICQHIIKSHGGRIWAQPSPQGGLSIGIRLPLTGKRNGYARKHDDR